MKDRIMSFLDIFKLLSKRISNSICFSLADVCQYRRVCVHLCTHVSTAECRWFMYLVEFPPLTSYHSSGIRLYTMK